MSRLDPLHQLKSTLASIATRDAVTNALEFSAVLSQRYSLEEQQQTISQRFFQMCLEAQGLDLALRLEELEPSQVRECLEVATRLIAMEGVNAAKVCKWFVSRGCMLALLAQDARSERDSLKRMVIRVQVTLADERVQYLAYGANGQPVLVDDAQSAHAFQVSAVAHLQGTYLEGFAARISPALQATWSDCQEVTAVAGTKG